MLLIKSPALMKFLAGALECIAVGILIATTYAWFMLGLGWNTDALLISLFAMGGSLLLNISYTSMLAVGLILDMFNAIDVDNEDI